MVLKHCTCFPLLYHVMKLLTTYLLAALAFYLYQHWDHYLICLALTRPNMCKPKSPAQTENIGVLLIEMLPVIENVLFLPLSPTELSKLIVLEIWECDFSYRIFIFFKKVVN